MTSQNPNVSDEPLCLCKTHYFHLCPEHVECGANPYARLRMITHALLCELTAARAAREEMQRHLDGYRKWQDGLVDQAKDAARYRWLRYGDNDERVICHDPFNGNVFLLRTEQLDAAIDNDLALERTDSAITASRSEGKLP